MCKYSPEQIAASIDLAALKPEHTWRDTVNVCSRATRFNCASVCIKPNFVSIAARKLEGTSVSVGTVINFPNGHSTPDVIALEAYKAVGEGAQELDMVINIGAARGGQWSTVEYGIRTIADIGYEWNAIVKIILETCYLPASAIQTACELCVNIKVDFVKTSTGFGTHGATPEAVTLMNEIVAGKCQIKASGGIATYEDAKRYLDLGCTRLGSSRVEELFPC